MKKYNVAVVGATGAVGETMRQILAERAFPIKRLTLLASSASAGCRLKFQESSIEVGDLAAADFSDIDIALFSAGGDVSRRYAPQAAEAGAVVVDNSSAFRMEPDVPLVIPEVNPRDINEHHGIIANPNCSTIQMVLVLKPLDDAFKIKRVVATTYQAVSGTGRRAISELLSQTKDIFANKSFQPRVYPHQIAFNVLPHIDVFLDDGYTKEELKMVNETRKILHRPQLALTATAARVPVLNSHSEAVNIEFERDFVLEEARRILSRAPGVEVVDDIASAVYPLAVEAAGKDPAFVGRIRRDFSVASGMNVWIVSDNLRKGAALNAVQIAELLIDKW